MGLEIFGVLLVHSGPIFNKAMELLMGDGLEASTKNLLSSEASYARVA